MEDSFARAVEADSPDEAFNVYGRLRDEQPVYFSDTMQAYIFTRFADVQRVLSDPETFSSAPGDSLFSMANFASAYFPLYEEEGLPPHVPVLLATDGDLHRRHRSAVDAPFGPGSVKRMEGRIFEVADWLIDGFVDAGKVDFYDRFCLKLPLHVMLGILGIPIDEHNEQILKDGAYAEMRLVGAAFETEEVRKELHREHIKLYKMVQPFIEKYRAHPEDSLLSQMIHNVPANDEKLSDAELLSLVSQLNIGGNETSTNALGNMFETAMRLGYEQRLRDNRDEIPNFIEETLRLECPVPALPRWSTRETEFEGVTIPAGSLVYVSYLAANRDDRRFECPAALNMERPQIRNHLALGMGPHYCLGAFLGRAMLRIAMNRVLDRMKNLRLDPDAPPPRRDNKLHTRGFLSLPILFDRA